MHKICGLELHEISFDFSLFSWISLGFLILFEVVVDRYPEHIVLVLELVDLLVLLRSPLVHFVLLFDRLQLPLVLVDRVFNPLHVIFQLTYPLGLFLPERYFGVDLLKVLELIVQIHVVRMVHLAVTTRLPPRVCSAGACPPHCARYLQSCLPCTSP